MYMTLTFTKLLGTSEITGTIIVPHILVLKLIEHLCVYMCYLTHSQIHIFLGHMFSSYCFFNIFVILYELSKILFFLSFLNFYQFVNETYMKMYF
jgi:hypothetical protein